MLDFDQYASPAVANTAHMLRGAGSTAARAGMRRRPDRDPFFVNVLTWLGDHSETTTCALWGAWREGFDRDMVRLAARWVVTVDGRLVGDEVTGDRAQAQTLAQVEGERHPADVDVRVITVAHLAARRGAPWRPLWHVEDQERDRPVGTFSDITDACEYARDLNGGHTIGGRYVVRDEEHRAIWGAPSVVYSASMTRTPTITAFPRCGRRLPVDHVLCGRRLAPGTDGLRCRRHGALDPADVLPAVLPAVVVPAAAAARPTEQP